MSRLRFALLSALLLSSAAGADLTGQLGITYPDRGFVSVRPATHWQNSLVTGNGTIGALVPGQVNHDQIVLSHEWLFLPANPPRKHPPMPKYLAEIRRLVLDLKGDEANELIQRVGRENGFPGIVWTDPLIPAAVLHFETGDREEPARYARSVNWETGETLVAWENSRGLYHRRMFVSRADGIAVLQIRSPRGDRVNCRLRLDQLSEEGDNERNRRAIQEAKKVVKAARASAEDGWLTYETEFEHLWPEALGGYSVAARVVTAGGAAKAAGGWLSIRDAGEVLVLAKVDLHTPYDPNGVSKTKAALERVAASYQGLLARHARIHGELMDRVSLRIGRDAERGLPSEELIHGSSVGATSPTLIEKVFDAGRYNVISSTGDLPPTLQGIWGGTWRPAWSSDFTQDGNVQAAVASGLNGNFAETTRAYLNNLSDMLDDFKVNARKLYGMRGIWVPSRTSDYGQVLHFARFPGLFWVAGAGWLSQFYYDYWLYTGDRSFLEHQALPFMLEAAAFYEDFLTIERDGKYVFTPSYSPENHPLGQSTVVPNATMDVAVVKQLLRNLIALGQEVEIAPARLQRWKEILAKLPAYQVDVHGNFKEWLWPGLENNDEHRHASHLYPLFYGVDPEIAADPALQQAARRAIDNRLNFRRARHGGVMAFGLMQDGLAAAHLRDRRLAYECLEWMANSYWTTGMVSLHNPKELFNIDISGGLPAVVIEMLMQSTPGGEIHLLPVLPSEWPDGSITGIRARGGFELDLSWIGGKLSKVRLRSLLGKPCTVIYGNKRVELKTEKGQTYELGSRLSG